MNQNIEALVEACKRKGISYATHHKTGNLVSVEKNGNTYLFANWSTPINTQSADRLCEDKDFFYSYFNDTVHMPKTVSFVDPDVQHKFRAYVKEKNIDEIIATIEGALQYPLIVKKNRGAWGVNVFKASRTDELREGLITIFDRKSADYDYIALAQEYIDIAHEYRAVYLNGEYMFAYEKVKEGARFVGNLSPLHWEGAHAKLVDDATAAEITEFCRPLFDTYRIPFCGFDIAKDIQGAYWMIEGNSKPGLGYFIADCGTEKVVELYEKMIDILP